MPAIPDCPCRVLDFAAAVRCLAGGGVLVYPTETFYALGCLAARPDAVEQVYQLKRREAKKTLPLMAGDMRQVMDMFAVGPAAQRLAGVFWPGPLTLLLPLRDALSELPAPLVDARGLAAVRISGNPQARELARMAGGLLTSSSANISGDKPAAAIAGLSPRLLRELAASPAPSGLLPAAEGFPTPSGRLPSTIVEPLSDIALRIVREGAISRFELAAAGFSCID